MALKAIMLRKKLNDAQKALEALRAKDAEFEKREAELEKSIDETTTQEERDAVDGEIEKFEAEKSESWSSPWLTKKRHRIPTHRRKIPHRWKKRERRKRS